jgi:hypothetical protein
MSAWIIAIQAAIYALMFAARKRATVVRTLLPAVCNPVPGRMLARKLSKQMHSATRLQRTVASKSTEAIRYFVGTVAFEQLMLVAVLRLWSYWRRKRGDKWF